MEDIIGYLAFVLRFVDSDTYAVILFANEGIDGTQTVVTAVAATLFEADGTEGEIDIIVDHNNVVGIDLEKLPDGLDTFAREIHVRRGLEKKKIAVAIEFAVKRGFGDIPRSGVGDEAVDDTPTDIVAVHRIAWSGVSQTNKQHLSVP